MAVGVTSSVEVRAESRKILLPEKKMECRGATETSLFILREREQTSERAGKETRGRGRGGAASPLSTEPGAGPDLTTQRA